MKIWRKVQTLVVVIHPRPIVQFWEPKFSFILFQNQYRYDWAQNPNVTIELASLKGGHSRQYYLEFTDMLKDTEHSSSMRRNKVWGKLLQTKLNFILASIFTGKLIYTVVRTIPWNNKDSERNKLKGQWYIFCTCDPDSDFTNQPWPRCRGITPEISDQHFRGPEKPIKRYIFIVKDVIVDWDYLFTSEQMRLP